MRAGGGGGMWRDEKKRGVVDIELILIRSFSEEEDGDSYVGLCMLYVLVYFSVKLKPSPRPTRKVARSLVPYSAMGVVCEVCVVAFVDGKDVGFVEEQRSVPIAPRARDWVFDWS